MFRLVTTALGFGLIAACEFTGPPAGSPTIDAGEIDVPDAAIDAPPPDAAPTTLVFRAGTGSTIVLDTWPFEGRPDEIRGDLADFGWDLSRDEMSDNGEAFGLLEFDFIGSSAEQVPVSSTVVQASLFLTVANPGDGAMVGDALIDWDESTTWNGFGAAAGPDPDVDFDATGAVALAAPMSNGEIGLDVTGSVARWVSATRPSRGWLLRSEGGDGVRVRSSEFANEAARPRLEVTFLPP